MRKSVITQKKDRRTRVKRGIRSRLTGTTERPRLSVFRSNSAIYAQIINDEQGHTLVSVSSRVKALLSADGTKQDKSREAGKLLAQQALAAGITSVVFDRNGYKYHGRVKALAEGAREGGLNF